MANEIKIATDNDFNVYVLLFNKAGLVWNGTTFVTYVTANRSTYALTATEQGTSSGIYYADFPSAITTGGTYSYYGYVRTGGSPAEPPTDGVVGTGSVDWTGSASASSATGAMAASDWAEYVRRAGWKRTDKDTELYECTTDAIQEMRRRFMFDEAEAETVTTDSISVAGDFKLDLESDFGLLLGVVLEDDDTGTPLKQVTKAQFDKLYPSINVESDNGYPKHFCVYAGQIYIGPRPDSTDYDYRISYSRRAGTITSTTTGVPFTNLYRDVLADNVLYRLYKLMDKFDKAEYFRGKFEEGFYQATHRERVNSGEHCFIQRGFNV